MRKPRTGQVKFAQGPRKFWRWKVRSLANRLYAVSNVQGRQTLDGARQEALEAAEIMAGECLGFGLPDPDQPRVDRWLRQLAVWLLQR